MIKDLILLVADKNTQFALDGLLQRHVALQIRPIEYDIYIHPLRDPGVYREASDFLRPFHRQYRYAVVFLDREGSGQENKPASTIEQEIKTGLERNGWQNRAESVVFDPELEIWVWVNSRKLATYTGWDNLQALLDFMQNGGYWATNSPKPQRPKEAFEEALREKRIQRSSAIYKRIASDVDFQGCREPSFERFRCVLRDWFNG